MAQDLQFSCTCGAVTGHIDHKSVKTGNHAVCHCNSCRCSELYKSQPDPFGHGASIFQTTPDHIHFDTGQDNLACFSFGEKNLLRWYASCCDAPMMNTMRSPKFSFAGVNMARLADTKPVGRVRSTGFIPGPKGKQSHKGALGMSFRLARNMLANRLSGRWRETPFFDENGTPVAPPHVLSSDEKRALPLKG